MILSVQKILALFTVLVFLIACSQSESPNETLPHVKPDAVTTFSAELNRKNQIVLNWAYDELADSVEFVVRRSSESTPQDVTHGILVFQGYETEFIDNVESDDLYFYSIFVINKAGNVSPAYSISIDVVLDVTPPARVGNVVTNVFGDNQIRLIWANPDDEDLLEVVIRRIEADSALGVADGTIVFQGIANEYVDTAPKSIEYKYGFFTLDHAGNSNNIPIMVSVTASDLLPPQLILLTHDNGDQAIDQESVVEVTFSEGVNIESLILIADNQEQDEIEIGNYVLSEDRATIQIDYASISNILPDISYRIEIVVSDNSENVALITPEQLVAILIPDTFAPNILAVFPQEAATNVPTTSLARIVFSESVHPLVQWENSIQIDKGLIQNFRETRYQGDPTIEFNMINLPGDELITLSVDDILDDKNNGLTNFTWSFTASENVLPVVINRYPRTGQKLVGVDVKPSFTFNKPLNPATINGTEFTVGNLNLAAVLSDDHQTLELQPPEGGFGYGNKYNLVISGQTIEDMDGNSIGRITSNFDTLGEPVMLNVHSDSEVKLLDVQFAPNGHGIMLLRVSNGHRDTLTYHEFVDGFWSNQKIIASFAPDNFSFEQLAVSNDAAVVIVNERAYLIGPDGLEKIINGGRYDAANQQEVESEVALFAYTNHDGNEILLITRDNFYYYEIHPGSGGTFSHTSYTKENKTRHIYGHMYRNGTWTQTLIHEYPGKHLFESNEFSRQHVHLSTTNGETPYLITMKFFDTVYSNGSRYGIKLFDGTQWVKPSVNVEWDRFRSISHLQNGKDGVYHHLFRTRPKLSSNGKDDFYFSVFSSAEPAVQTLLMEDTADYCADFVTIGTQLHLICKRRIISEDQSLYEAAVLHYIFENNELVAKNEVKRFAPGEWANIGELVKVGNNLLLIVNNRKDYYQIEQNYLSFSTYRNGEWNNQPQSQPGLLMSTVAGEKFVLAYKKYSLINKDVEISLKGFDQQSGWSESLNIAKVPRDLLDTINLKLTDTQNQIKLLMSEMLPQKSVSIRSVDIQNKKIETGTISVLDTNAISGSVIGGPEIYEKGNQAIMVWSQKHGLGEQFYLRDLNLGANSVNIDTTAYWNPARILADVTSFPSIAFQGSKAFLVWVQGNHLMGQYFDTETRVISNSLLLHEFAADVELQSVYAESNGSGFQVMAQASDELHVLLSADGIDWENTMQSYDIVTSEILLASNGQGYFALMRGENHLHFLFNNGVSHGVLETHTDLGYQSDIEMETLNNRYVLMIRHRGDIYTAIHGEDAWDLELTFLLQNCSCDGRLIKQDSKISLFKTKWLEGVTVQYSLQGNTWESEDSMPKLDITDNNLIPSKGNAFVLLYAEQLGLSGRYFFTPTQYDRRGWLRSFPLGTTFHLGSLRTTQKSNDAIAVWLEDNRRELSLLSSSSRLWPITINPIPLPGLGGVTPSL
ncbi:MAG: Ig-like domain-containing protein [Gammaproteobacteria bacterium]|nr:Ig-like domain-containing protein [Gammaproteobacteria bacterium]